MKPSKIVLLGPESTGKTTLVFQLATHFNAPFVAEFAREYLEQKADPTYEFEDLETIAREQVNRVKLALAATPKLLFCDTDLTTLHIWSLDKFDRKIAFVEENLIAQKADLYLLCAPDIAWQPDPLREDAARRELLFEWNFEALRAMKAKVKIVTGLHETRLANAIAAVNSFLKP